MPVLRTRAAPRPLRELAHRSHASWVRPFMSDPTRVPPIGGAVPIRPFRHHRCSPVRGPGSNPVRQPHNTALRHLSQPTHSAPHASGARVAGMVCARHAPPPSRACHRPCWRRDHETLTRALSRAPRKVRVGRLAEASHRRECQPHGVTTRPTHSPVEMLDSVSPELVTRQG